MCINICVCIQSSIVLVQDLKAEKKKKRYKSFTPPIFKKTKGHRVLCLDGGGMRGLIQIEVLSHITEVTGREIHELFDWIVGTSTGGIVALALVYGCSTCKFVTYMYMYVCISVVLIKGHSRSP